MRWSIMASWARLEGGFACAVHVAELQAEADAVVIPFIENEVGEIVEDAVFAALDAAALDGEVFGVNADDSAAGVEVGSVVAVDDEFLGFGMDTDVKISFIKFLLKKC